MTYGPGGDGPAQVSRAVRYGTAPDGTELLLDEYLPGSEGPLPAVPVLHGGGWKGGDRTVIAPEAQDFAAAGFAAYAVDFRNAPGGTGDDPWPAQIEDLQAAVRYVRSLPYVDGVGVFGSLLAATWRSTWGRPASWGTADRTQSPASPAHRCSKSSIRATRHPRAPSRTSSDAA
nr:alpha/beta hydrolase fold domain-containing protein [Actinomycetota bacterium]